MASIYLSMDMMMAHLEEELINYPRVEAIMGLRNHLGIAEDLVESHLVHLAPARSITPSSRKSRGGLMRSKGEGSEIKRVQSLIKPTRKVTERNHLNMAVVLNPTRV